MKTFIRNSLKLLKILLTFNLALTVVSSSIFAEEISKKEKTVVGVMIPLSKPAVGAAIHPRKSHKDIDLNRKKAREAHDKISKYACFNNPDLNGCSEFTANYCAKNPTDRYCVYSNSISYCQDNKDTAPNCQ